MPDKFLCNECNEEHNIPQPDTGKRECILVHAPNQQKNFTPLPGVKYCQDCIERGFNPPNIATREWQAGYFVCEDCFQPIMNNMTNVAPAEIKSVMGKITGDIPILESIYSILQIPPELRFDSVETTCKHHDKIFNFHAPANVNKSLEAISNELEQWQITWFHIKYAIEPLQQRISVLKEELRRERNLNGVKDTAESYVKPSKTAKTSKTKQTALDSLVKTLGLSKEQVEALAQKSREKEFKKVMGLCHRCGTAHDSDECPPNSPILNTGVKKPVQPTALGAKANGEVKSPEPKTDNNKTTKEELLAKARARLGK